MITLSSDVNIQMAAVTSPTRSLELATFQNFVALGDGRLVSLGRTVISSMMNVCLPTNCPISVFMPAVNDWRLWRFDDEDVDKAAVAKLVNRSLD